MRARVVTFTIGLALSLVPLVGAAGPAVAATPFVDIASPGPLNHIYIGNELSCQVSHTGDTDLQFFPSSTKPGDCGTFIATGGVLYAPDFANHGGTATSGLGPRTVFTPISQTPVTGSGSAADPFKVVTRVSLGATGLSATETDSYVVGRELYQTDVTISNAGGATASGIIYRAGDCFLAGSDAGKGMSSAAERSVGCSKNTNNTPLGRIEQWFPLTGGNHFYEDFYSTVWAKIGSKTDFPDTCAKCSVQIDNGAGLSWAFSVPAGGSSTFSHNTTFSPTGQTGGGATGLQFYFAEGNTLTDFHEYLLLANPNTSTISVAVTYYFDDGSAPQPTTVNLAGQSRTTVDVPTVVSPGRTGVSIGVVSPISIVAERSLFFDHDFGNIGRASGSEAMLPPRLPSTSWSFAEGSTLDGFQEYLTIQNPGTAASNVNITYGLEGGGSATSAVTVPAGQRATLDVNQEIGDGVVGHSTFINASGAVVVERPMYFNRAVGDDRVVINGGHGAFGSVPSQSWLFAEGTVLPEFSTYLTISNPDPSAAAPVRIDYFFSDGTTAVKTASVASGSRLTVRVFDLTDPAGVGRNVGRIEDRGVSMRVSTTSSAGIVVERPTYFHRTIVSGGSEINEGHDTQGATTAATRWLFGEGSTLPGFFPFLTILNSNTETVSVNITYTVDSGPPVARTVSAAATSRLTVQVFGPAGAGGVGGEFTGFGIIVTTSKPVVVERPFYTSRLIPGLPFIIGGSVVVGLPG